MRERWGLSLGRIRRIREENRLEGAFQRYMERVGDFLLLTAEIEGVLGKGLSLEEWAAFNHRLYEDILPENYTNSFANPRAAAQLLGRERGRLLSALYAELYSLPAYLHEGRLEDAVIRVELFLEIYGAFLAEGEEGRLPSGKVLRELYSGFSYDCLEEILRREVSRQYSLKEKPAAFLDAADLSDLRYLYRSGEYITEKEIKLASFLNSLPEETVGRMASAYTEGYRRGFAAMRKDISRKKTVNLSYPIGMERMVKRAVENFRAMGLEPIPYRAPVSFLAGRKLYKSGFTGAIANRQFEYDHENDKAIYVNSRFFCRKLEAYRQALEQVREEAALMGGPAVIEGFGEAPFVPVPKEENLKLSEKQKEQEVAYQAGAGELLDQYVKRRERSFTIIAFPSPAIGGRFEEIFWETIRLNTLDNEIYTHYQQLIIDVLDGAVCVEIRGCGANETKLTIALPELKDRQEQTNFENCVADVNIPVGEVFTSPALKGTNGLLHVPRVFLQGLEYRNLRLNFREGMIGEYGCDNFAADGKDGREALAEGKKLIREKLLHHHDSLPMGEFAIGTNTTAYRMAKRYGIEALLPVLIAEKTGPHFAVGDTCFSREEEAATYNPDGKRMMAKENERSMLRHTDRSKAYFHCHTDITIPYEELGLLAAVEAGGRRTPIIRQGRFVLPGLEGLNEPFDE